MENKTDKTTLIASAPVPKLLLKMALPASVSLLFSSLYNIIDTLFVSYLGQDALAGISLVNPIVLILSAIGIGVGTGLNSWVSRLLGQKKYKTISTYILSAFSCGVIFWILFALFGIFLSRFYISQFSTHVEVVNHAVCYMTIILCGCFGNLLCQIGYSCMQGTGEMTKPMIAQIIGLAINTFLDPFLIFGIGPFPKMELAGAAISTVLSESISMIIILWMVFKNKNPKVKVQLRLSHIKASTMFDILKVGIPASLVTIVSSVAMTFLNKILISYSPAAVAVYGVFLKLNNFMIMPIFAVLRAANSILGYSYGAKNLDRFNKTVLWSCIYGGIVYSVSAVIVNIFPVQLLMIFNTSQDMLDIGIVCLRVLSTTFLLAGISIPLSNCFNPTGKSIISLSSSLFRQLIVIVPCAYLFGEIGGIDLLWWAFPVADILNLIFIIIVYRIFLKQVKMRFDKD